MTKTVFHRDWRDWISQKLRVMISRTKERQPSRPYLGRSLDKFERFVPKLSQQAERTFELEEVCRMVNHPGDEELWSSSSASKFLHYLEGIGVIKIRYAGRSGNAYRLLKNFALAPDPSRQGTVRIPRAELTPARDKEEESNVLPEVEFDAMPATPVNAPDETVELDGAVMLAAIDRITDNLGGVSLNFRTDLTGPQASVAYTAQNIVSKAMADLSRLRTAVLRGDGTPLQEILNGA